MKKQFLINNYRTKKIGKKYLVTVYHGDFCFLDEKEYKKLKLEKIDNSLFKKLKEKGILLEEKDINKIASRYRNKKSFLWQGTSLHIVVPTLRCNQNCVYCHASSKPINSKGYDMNKKTAKATVDFIFQSPSNAITIEFQGGEPLARFDIVKYIVKYAKEINKKARKELDFSVVTNLSLMNRKKLKFLIDENIGICTSLDGPAVLHNKNRRFKGGSYSYAKKWVKEINKEYKKRKIEKRRANALITLTRSSLKYPKEIVDEYVKLGLKDIHLRFLNRLGIASKSWNFISYSAEDFILFWKKAMDYILMLNKRGIFIRERIACIMLQKILTGKDPNYLDLRSPCGAAIGQLLYNYDGNIYTCDEARMLGEDTFKLGTVNDKYKDLTTSPQSCAIIAASVNDVFCDSCVYKPYCGVCPVCNYAEQGSIIAKIPETMRCKIFKAQFDYVFEKLENRKARKIFESWLRV